MLAASALSDDALVSEVARLAGHERQVTAQLVAMLAELDARRLYLPAGCSSLFTYCTQVLHLSEHAAYHRIEAARAGRRFPEILERLACADLTLTTVTLLASHLTEANHRALLDAARHKSKREVEHLVAALKPQADAPSVLRKLPPAGSVSLAPSLHQQTAVPGLQGESDGMVTASVPLPRAASVAPARRAVVTPLAPERYKLQLTISRETHDKLRRAQDLLRHLVPNGDPAPIVDRALTLLVAALEKRKVAAVKGSRTNQAKPADTKDGQAPLAGESPKRQDARSRQIPAAVRRSVWARDAGQCAFVGTAGRCTERGMLEFHHVVPYADGGRATPDNLELRCRRHNQYEAERWFGEPGGRLVLREVTLVRR